MTKLKTTSPICVRIVIAFLEFLSYVEGMTNTEIGYLKDLEIALKEIFRISGSDMESKKPEVSLLNIFNAPETKPEVDETMSEIRSTTADMPTASSSQGPAIKIGMSDAQLFHEFYVRVEACRFFEFIFGENYRARFSRAKNLFKAALELLIEVGTQTFDLPILADAFQTLGHKSLNLKCYYKSVEFYSCAIALSRDNAEFFCDRASALMMIERYQEAMNDCCKAIRLKPNYVRAYLGIGCIYLEQGKSIDAICYGFIKVLQIDPYNADALDRLEVAEDKLRQQLLWINDQLGYHSDCDFIPINSYKHKADNQDIVLTFRAAPPEEGGSGGGGSGNASEPTWKLVVEDEVDGRNSDTVANFMDLYHSSRVNKLKNHRLHEKNVCFNIS